MNYSHLSLISKEVLFDCACRILRSASRLKPVSQCRAFESSVTTYLYWKMASLYEFALIVISSDCQTWP